MGLDQHPAWTVRALEIGGVGTRAPVHVRFLAGFVRRDNTELRRSVAGCAFGRSRILAGGLTSCKQARDASLSLAVECSQFAVIRDLMQWSGPAKRRAKGSIQIVQTTPLFVLSFAILHPPTSLSGA